MTRWTVLYTICITLNKPSPTTLNITIHHRLILIIGTGWCTSIIMRIVPDACWTFGNTIRSIIKISLNTINTGKLTCTLLTRWYTINTWYVIKYISLRWTGWIACVVVKVGIYTLYTVGWVKARYTEGWAKLARQVRRALIMQDRAIIQTYSVEKE